MSWSRNVERDREICRLRLAGSSTRELAERYGLTCQGIEYILSRGGVPKRCDLLVPRGRRPSAPSGHGFAPQFGPRCACGHLGFVHLHGTDKCLNAQCGCGRATVADIRFSMDDLRARVGRRAERTDACQS